jgi:imidazole glycerol phosphate synthase subunit HisF
LLAASIFHDDDMTVGDVKRALAALGVHVRA